MSLITAHNVSVSFGSKTVLTDVNLTVHSGEIVTLIGPNGAGKSTLLRTVLGLIPPSQGTVHRKAGIRIGYMPQKLWVEPFLPLSVLRFLQLAREWKSEAHLNAILAELAIEPLQHQPIQSISGGELQRVLLARALLGGPQLLVLDEPTQGIDVLGQDELYQLILTIRDKQGCGILMVSHDLHLVMAGTDRVICLNKHVCCSGHPEAVSHHPEFLNLFGAREPSGLAVYTHRHNHRHDIGGDICS